MGKIIIFILIMLLFSTPLSAQIKDIEGWNDSKWGMTEDNILSIFKDKAMKLNENKKVMGLTNQWDAYCPIMIDLFEIKNNIYQVEFIFDNLTKKLIKAIIRGTKEKPTEGQFDDLEQILTEKYGDPSYKKDDRTPDKRLGRSGVVLPGSTLLERSWNFPSTVIELKYIESEIIGNKTFIIYRKTTKEILDKI